MKLAQLLVVYQPQDIVSLSFDKDGDILRVDLKPATAPAQDAASSNSAKQADKPAKLRASSDISLAGPIPLHVLD
jgi:hypothetical protein